MLQDGEETGNPEDSFEFLDSATTANDATNVAGSESQDDEVSPLSDHLPRQHESVPPVVGRQEQPIRPGSETRVNQRFLAAVFGYCIVITGLMLWLWISGRISWQANHPLESLPDVRPLEENEFQSVPANAELPDQHVLRLGESRRFGDVVVTPQKVTRESLQFEGFLSGQLDPLLTSQPVFKLWLECQNVAADYAFPPLDAWLLTSRSPRDGQDEATFANSFLRVAPEGSEEPGRLLNYLQLPESNFRIAGQESGRVLSPGDALTTFIASAEPAPGLIPDGACDFVWRIQFRKGVGASGNGVTTLVDVRFSSSEIESTTQPE